MIATKRFSVRTILSITTGRLLTESDEPGDNGIGKVYEILNWMTSDNLFTHQLGRACGECEPWLARWFPELLVCGSDDQLSRLDLLLSAMSPDDAIKTWVIGFPSLKPTYDVPKIPADDHEKRNPVEELEEMVGKDKVIVLPIPSEE